ncbi:hypothetical protein ASZ90_009777 [hydrocarbon metagenome]|uniref:Uncharacterized protein n=1 Tax=hydrocarbon metagenome TaxID=938273 RepID=A0A0W8FIK8_9ZZZZ|nr:hypothetical protein [Methanomicrobiaceae archaeon]
MKRGYSRHVLPDTTSIGRDPGVDAIQISIISSRPSHGIGTSGKGRESDGEVAALPTA